MSPLPNFHSCRINPSDYDRYARKNCEQKHKGKCIDVLYGIKGKTSKVASLRYPKTVWSAAAARSHCKGRGGSFEAALEEFSPKVVKLRLPDSFATIDAQWLSQLSNDEIIRLHYEIKDTSLLPLNLGSAVLKELIDRGLRPPEVEPKKPLIRFLGPLRGTVVENIIESIKERIGDDKA